MPRSRESRLSKLWYAGGYWHLLLIPFSALFALLSGVRRMLYRRGFKRSVRVSVPVVVIGNISVGGTGKTPVTIWLASQLRARGFTPGIVSRGYGGLTGDTPVQVNASSDPQIVGDEPLLLATRSHCPVVVHPDRAAAAAELIAMGVNVVLTDDGLQHYRLQRDFEIAVVDGARGFGNGWLLPAGPLRESRKRLGTVDRVLVHLTAADTAMPAELASQTEKTTGFHLITHDLFCVVGGDSQNFESLRGKTVHGVAGIGNPERFFLSLEMRGLDVIRHPFPDHAQLTARDLAFDDEYDIVMTEKDAVKCREFATARHWYVPVDVDMHDESWLDGLVDKLGPVTMQST